jgi:hypothetical protein
VVAEYIPKVTNELRDKIKIKKAELKRLAPGCLTREEMRAKLIHIVARIVNGFEALISARDSRSESELHVAARASEQYEQFASNITKELPNFLTDEFAQELEGLVKETRGARSRPRQLHERPGVQTRHAQSVRRHRQNSHRRSH